MIPDDKPGPNEKLTADGSEVGDYSDIDADLLEDDDFLNVTQGDDGKTGASPGGRAAVRYEKLAMRPQEAFQPQSTPMEAKRRFMVFNAVGSISCRNEVAFNAIEIEFADINAHRAIRFNDYSGFTMAAMDNNGAIFASPEVKERGGDVNASQLHYRHFDPWASQSDWTIALEEGESAEAVACGASFVAVATSKRFLRVFTTSGLQTHIEMFPGPALCMHGNGDLLSFVNHTPLSGADEIQDLQFQLLNVSTRKGLAGGRLPLSPGTTLEWLQVTDAGIVATMDSDGYVNVFASAVGVAGAWVPVLDIKTRNKSRDWFWPIRLDADCLTGVVCKEEKRYPDVLQPVLGRYELSMPLVKTDAQEEVLLRGAIFAASGDDEADVAAQRLELDKKILQLVNAACEQKKLLRALDLAKQMVNEKALDAAITLARRHRLSNLAERMDMYRQVRFAEEEDVEEEEEEEYEEEEEEEPRREETSQKRARFTAPAPASPVASDEEEAVGERADDMDTPPGPAKSVPQQPRAMPSLFAAKSRLQSAGGAVAGKQQAFVEKLKSMAAADVNPPKRAGPLGIGGLGKRSVAGKTGKRK